jgi:hypothetical protein
MMSAIRSSSTDLPSLATSARRAAGPDAAAPRLLGQRKEPELRLIGTPRQPGEKVPGAQAAPGQAPQQPPSKSSGAPGEPFAARRQEAPAPAGGSQESGGASASPGGPGTLTADQQQEVSDLEHIDARVRAHEAAHQAAGGALTGAVHLQFVVGPDGRSYAVGGDVSIRIASGRTPDETIANAEQVVRAALAPADPSGQDLAVASAALQLVAQAESQKLQQITQSEPQSRTQPQAQQRPLLPLLVPQRPAQPVQVQFAPGQAAKAVGTYQRASWSASTGTVSVSA